MMPILCKNWHTNNGCFKNSHLNLNLTNAFYAYALQSALLALAAHATDSIKADRLKIYCVSYRKGWDLFHFCIP